MKSVVAVSSKHKSKFSWQEFICGCGAAMFEVTLTYPIHKLMFRQQLHGFFLKSAVLQLKSEGFVTLYRGLLPPLIQKTSTRALMFGSFDYYKRFFQCEGSNLRCRSLAAFLSGASEAMLCPLERVQTLLLSSQYHNHFKNTFHAFSELRTYGLREYYRGFSAVLFRNGFSNIIFFGAREPIKNFVPSVVGGRTFVGDFIAGASLGAFISALFYPVSVAKTRMQWQLGGGFVWPWTTLSEILHERDGKLRRLYRGVHLSCMRSLIAWGVINSVYEILAQSLFARHR